MTSESETLIAGFERLVQQNNTQGAWALLTRHGISDSNIPDSPSSGNEFWAEEMGVLLQKALKWRLVSPGRSRLSPEQEAEEFRRDQRSLEAIREIRELTRNAVWLPDAQREKAIRRFDEAERAIERFMRFGLDDWNFCGYGRSSRKRTAVGPSMLGPSPRSFPRRIRGVLCDRGRGGQSQLRG